MNVDADKISVPLWLTTLSGSPPHSGHFGVGAGEGGVTGEAGEFTFDADVIGFTPTAAGAGGVAAEAAEADADTPGLTVNGFSVMLDRFSLDLDIGGVLGFTLKLALAALSDAVNAIATIDIDIESRHVAKVRFAAGVLLTKLFILLYIFEDNCTINSCLNSAFHPQVY